MRSRLLLPLAATVLIACPASADYGSPPPQPASTATSPEQAAALSHQQAERYFADGYADIARAGKETRKGKRNGALKRYRRALEHCQQAVQLDSTYYEAWNLVGFSARMLGDYPASFSAYRVALRLKPDFALAHEYYGEGLLETGDIAGAREQLEELRKTGTPELVAELESAIAKHRAEHPESSTTPPADSSGTSGANR